MKTVKSFRSIVNEELIAGPNAEKYATDLGVDVKTKSGETSSELVSGGPIESILLDIVKDLEKMTQFQFTVTGGNDEFHQNLRGDSRHKSGFAVDITFPQANDKAARKKVEDSILTLMLSGKYAENDQRIGAINEYDRPTSHSTGGHFHISLGPDDSNRDGWECLLPLNGISTYSQVRKVANTGVKVWEGGADVVEINQPTDNKRIKKKFKFFSKEDKKTLIATRKGDNEFTVRSKKRDDYGKIIRNGTSIVWERGGQKKDITSDPLGQTFKRLFETQQFERTNIKRSSASLNLSQVGNDKEFYESILKQIGANPTAEKMKFFYAWRKAEGGSARNNPFNTTFNLSKDSGQTNYNSTGVKNYSAPEYGIEATANTLKLHYYTDIVNMLKNDNITADELAASNSLNTWGTGGLVAKVLNTNSITPPQIYA